MSSSAYFLLSIVLALAFYVVTPGAGAFLVRFRWRRFRMRVLESQELPELRYGAVEDGERYRVSGRLEAVQGDDIVWIEKEGLSVGVSLKQVPMYIIPSGHDGKSRGLPDETPTVVYWKEMFALAEGTQFYVAGRVVEESGGVVFRGETADDPLVLVYDGPEQSLVKRTIWTGRQRNEYWNHLTMPALTVGFLAQLVIAVVSVGQSRSAALVATVFSLVPLLPLIPPGVIGYYAYRRIWRAARRRRAIRDVSRIGSAGTVTERSIIGGQHIWPQELLAVALLIAGIAANAYIVAFVLALLVFS